LRCYPGAVGVAPGVGQAALRLNESRDGVRGGGASGLDEEQWPRSRIGIVRTRENRIFCGAGWQRTHFSLDTD